MQFMPLSLVLCSLPLRPQLQPHSMEPQVTLNVTFRNETQSFLVSDPENTTWADVEAMVSILLCIFTFCPEVSAYGIPVSSVIFAFLGSSRGWAVPCSKAQVNGFLLKSLEKIK